MPCCNALKRCFPKIYNKLFASKGSHRSSSTQAMENYTTLKEQKLIAEKVYYSAVKSVDPWTLIKSHLKLKGKVLTINDRKTKTDIGLDDVEKCYVIGFGKAVLPMAEATVQVLGSRVARCIVSVPEGTRDSQMSSIELYRGAKNNLPDANAAFAAQKIVELVKSCNTNDLLLVLISGGGSALLPAPVYPITIEEKTALTKQLSSAGATINEINIVRKEISLVKGGGIVRLCKSKKMASLILSDVSGDPLDIIASGPTVVSSTKNEKASDVLRRYFPDDTNIPESIRTCIREREKGTQERRESSERCHNFIIGNNKIALESAALTVSKSRFIPFILTATLSGEAKNIGTSLALLSIAFADKHNLTTDSVLPIFQELGLNGMEDDPKTTEKLCSLVLKSRKAGKKLCLLLGGEPTVKVTGKGIGGRNQELALSAALTLYKFQPPACITILSGGTDGIDGPCNAGGAVVNAALVRDAHEQNIDPAEYMNNNDSYNFFQKLSNAQYHLIPGHTGTNVMDVIVILID